jgi:hypothetical protein
MPWFVEDTFAKARSHRRAANGGRRKFAFRTRRSAWPTARRRATSAMNPRWLRATANRAASATRSRRSRVASMRRESRLEALAPRVRPIR